MGNAIMVEHIMKINVSELLVVRLTCKRCKTTAEMKIDALTDRTKDCRCPFCENPYLAGGAVPTGTPFEKLRESLRHLREANNLDMEFVVPAVEAENGSGSV